MGDTGVGKTALGVRFTTQQFILDYDPTIEGSYHRQFIIDDEPCILEILDSGGSRILEPLTAQWIRECDAFILVYSITSRVSFDSINGYSKRIEEIKGNDNIIFLVGNKNDLEDIRQVSVEEENELAEMINYKLFNTSAKTGLHVNDLFHDLVRLIRRNQPQQNTATK